MRSKNLMAGLTALTFVAVGFLAQSCSTSYLKPKAVASAAPCGVGNVYGGDITDLLNGGSIAGNNTGRANLFDTGASCGTAAGETAGDVLYSFTIDNAPVSILFSTCDAAGFDTLISLWDSCEPGTEASSNYLDCNDDTAGCANNTTELGYDFTNNGTYYVVVDGYDSSETGTFTLTTTIQP